MNIKYIALLFSVLIFSILFSSCNNDDTTTTYGSQSKDAQIYSFALEAPAPISKDSLTRAQDSIRFIQVNNTNYAIDQISGVIYNPDSMPFGTKLNKALVTASFNPTYGISKVEVITPDSLKGYLWNKTDSIDFSKGGVQFRVFAADGSTTKNYDIDIRIHEVDPNLIPWNQVSSFPLAGKSKTLLNKNIFYTYVQDNSGVSLYTSSRTNLSWSKQSLSGLSTTVNSESIFILNNSFYCIDGSGYSYSSSDGIKWIKQNNGKEIISILGILPSYDNTDDLLLVIFKDEKTYKFAKGKDLMSLEAITNVNSFPSDEIPDQFPKSSMASFTNLSSIKSDNMLILTGGVDFSGNNLSSTWLVKNVKNGLEIASFTVGSIFTGGPGLSNFVYNNLYYVMDNNQFYTSDNWGNTWSNAPEGQQPSEQMTKRIGQTVIVDSENNIWIFGGQSKQGSYLNDVWKGRLNKLSFK